MNSIGLIRSFSLGHHELASLTVKLKAEKKAAKIHHYAVADDGFIGLSPRIRSNLYHFSDDFNRLLDCSKQRETTPVAAQQIKFSLIEKDQKPLEAMAPIQPSQSMVKAYWSQLSGWWYGTKGESQLEATTAYLARFRGALGQSHDPSNIKWKITKYESQILGLRAKFAERFSDILQPKIEPAIPDNFVLIEDAGNLIVKELYAVLNSVVIEPENHLRFTQDHLAQVRRVYNTAFLQKLREELCRFPDLANLHTICSILFSELSLDKEVADTLELFDSMGAVMLGQKKEEVDPKIHGEHPFVKRINTLYARLNSVPYCAKAPILDQWGNSARGQWNRDFDPYRQGNPVHVLYRLSIGDRIVKAIGMGTPTIEDLWSRATLSPEFIGFGKSYKSRGLKHLFVLNQNTIPKTDFLSYVLNGDETNRCNLILGSQDKKELRGAIYAIALAKNSPFYSQKGEYKMMENAAAFRDELWQQVFVKPREISGCYIPQSIKDEISDFEPKVHNLIKGIHFHLFKGKETLTVEERKLFIEQFYDHFTKFLLVEMKFESYDISCKDAIDRAAASNAQFYSNTIIINDPKGEIEKVCQKKIESLMMVRALMVRKRPPIDERVERFAHGLDYSLANAEGLKALHRALFGDLQIGIFSCQALGD